MSKEKFTDESVMPWGMHSGKSMANVPARYLVSLLDSGKLSYGPVFDYVEENLDILRYEVAQENNKK